jgi:hypothetical protein
MATHHTIAEWVIHRDSRTIEKEQPGSCIVGVAYGMFWISSRRVTRKASVDYMSMPATMTIELKS